MYATCAVNELEPATEATSGGADPNKTDDTVSGVRVVHGIQRQEEREREREKMGNPLFTVCT